MSAKKPVKTVLITGCSSGFGLLTAARLSACGYSVYATMRNVDKKASLLSEVNLRQGKVNILALDVTQPESIKKVMQVIAENEGYLDVLINNAGYGIGGAFEDLSDQDIRQQFETNFFGVLNVTREAIPLMRQRGATKIINISSVSGFSASPCFSAYTSSKWALEGFSESLRYELKMFGIDVLLIQPGSYKTEIFYGNRKYAKNFDNENSPYYNLSQQLKKRIDTHLQQSNADPEQVAKLVERLIRSKNPGFRNIPDIKTKLMYALRKFLPYRVYGWMVEKAVLKSIKSPQ